MRSLAVKLSLAFLGVALTGTALVGAAVALRTRHDFGRFVVDRAHVDMVERLAEHYARTASWQDIEGIVPSSGAAPSGSRRPLPWAYTLADASGIVVATRGRQHQVGDLLGAEALAHAVPIVVDGALVGRVSFDPGEGAFPRPPSPETAFIERLNRAVLLSALGATIIALLLGVWLARTITQPVRALTAAAHLVAQGELGHQVTVRARDEVGDLARAFNQMSTDLAAASHQRRQMTADIAHDLRTPLTVILGYTEGLAAGMFAGTPAIFRSIHEEALHLKHLIDDLRTLSLADAGQISLERESCAPAALLARTAATRRPLAASRGIALHVTAAGDLPAVMVDPARMAQVLGNLVDNALRHTPSGGTITLSAEASAGAVLLHVADTGEGIDPADLPHIFARFYRADKARAHGEGASGLGLAIARSLVEAHGGTIGVESTPGQGATLTIRLPASGSADAV